MNVVIKINSNLINGTPIRFIEWCFIPVSNYNLYYYYLIPFFAKLNVEYLSFDNYYKFPSKRFDKALFFNNLFKYIHYVEENAQIIIPNNKDLFRKFKYKSIINHRIFYRFRPLFPMHFG